MRNALVASAALLALACAERSAAPDRPSSVKAPLALGFDAEKPGTLPKGWVVAATHPKGPLATWGAASDPSAPSPPNALALGATNHDSRATFNLCWTDRVRFADGTLEVAFKAVAGEIDQGGGPIWRVQDASNYYVCRANPLESNFRVYVVQKGERYQLASAALEITSDAWHTIKVEHAGEKIACWLDGKKLLEASDARIPEAGGVGLWTKADAVTSFDDLRVEVLGR